MVLTILTRFNPFLAIGFTCFITPNSFSLRHPCEVERLRHGLRAPAAADGCALGLGPQAPAGGKQHGKIMEHLRSFCYTFHDFIFYEALYDDFIKSMIWGDFMMFHDDKTWIFIIMVRGMMVEGVATKMGISRTNIQKWWFDVAWWLMNV